MSHFTEIKVNFNQKSEAELIAALEEQFGKGNVEVHGPEGSALYGYQGDNRAKLSESNPNYAPPCHIIIRKKHVGGAANDVGYRRNPDGTYTAYISDYDQTGNFSESKQNTVAKRYSELVSSKWAKQKGYTLKKEYKGNEVILTLEKYS